MSVSWNTGEAALIQSIRSHDAWDGFSRCLSAVPQSAPPPRLLWTVRPVPSVGTLGQAMALEYRLLRQVRRDFSKSRRSRAAKMFEDRSSKAILGGLGASFHREIKKLESDLEGQHASGDTALMRLEGHAVVVLYTSTELHLDRMNSLVLDSIENQISTLEKRLMQLRGKRRGHSEIDGAPVIYQLFRPGLPAILEACWKSWAEAVTEIWKVFAGLAAIQSVTK